MAPSLPWFGALCVVLAGTLGHAATRAEFGVSIHPVFSTSVYIPKNPHASEDSLEKEEHDLPKIQAAECKILNTTESGSELHEVKTFPTKSFSLFVKPESSFGKLVIRMNLHHILYVSDDSYSDEDFTLTSEDLTHSDSQWTHVKVEYYKYKRRGPDRHAFRISFANKTEYRVTHDSWLWHAFEGFTVLAQGGAKFLDNCAPLDLDEEGPVADYTLVGMWVMVGLMTTAAFLLFVLCLVWACLKYQDKDTDTSKSMKKYPVYHEFDEEVLERIKQKVESLRSGKSQNAPDTVVVSYPPRQENLYILDESGYGGVDGASTQRHHYEDIEKYYRHSYSAGNVYQNPLSVDEGGHKSSSTVDNIYESLPCIQRYLEKRGDEVRKSNIYVTS